MNKVEKALLFGGSVLLALVIYRMVFKSFLPTSVQTLIGV